MIIVRHAETDEALKGIVQGHQHGKLTENGKEQAKKLALRLKSEKIDVIFSSDLRRARNTTEELAKFHKVPVHYTPELRERCCGIFEGRSREEFYKAEKESSLSVPEFKPDSGESFVELRKRAQKFLNTMLENYEYYKGKSILVSSHGGWIKMLFSIILKKSIEEALEVAQKNTCVNIVVVDKNLNGRLIMLNDVGHL